MIKRTLYAAIIILASLLASCSQEYADTILFGGKVVTVDSAFTIAEAVAVRGDHILAVGPDDEVLRYGGRKTRMISLEGRSVLPGLIDAHLHPVEASLSELTDPIPDVHTLQELLDYIEQEAVARDPGNWIIHPKFFSTRIREMRLPTLEELDQVAPDHPVFLNGGYGGMLNSSALSLCGIDRNSANAGIMKDPVTGEPSGVIRYAAFPLVMAHVPQNEMSYEEELDALEAQIGRYNRVGLTGITDGTYRDSTIMQRYRDLKSRGRLTIRVNLTAGAPSFESEQQLASALDAMHPDGHAGDEWVKVSQVKTSVDGGILTGTAYMREPWGARAGEIHGFDDPEYRGVLVSSQQKLTSLAAALGSRGAKMTAHVTGGGGVDLLLDAYEAAHRRASVTENRFSIIHGNFFTPEAMERCASMGIISDMQPAWFYKDGEAMNYILGDRRIRTFLPAKSMIDAGMVLNGGSDHMVKFDSFTSTNPYNPFLAMWVLVTRRTEGGSVINPAEAISREEALKIYTINNAFGTFDEKIKGSLEPGKLADMILISKDFMSCPADSIPAIRVEATMVGGRFVYEAD